jgi:hypothetical protein
MIWTIPRLSLDSGLGRHAKVRRSYHLPVARGKPATAAQGAQKSHNRRTGNPQTAALPPRTIGMLSARQAAEHRPVSPAEQILDLLRKVDMQVVVDEGDHDACIRALHRALIEQAGDKAPGLSAAA